MRRIFLSDLAQEEIFLKNQTLTIIRIETQEQLQDFRCIFGATFGTGARVTPRLKDGILLIRLHSVINAVNPPNSETLKNIKKTKKRKGDREVARSSDDELVCCDQKCDLIQISFDHTTSVAAIAVVFTRMIVGEDNCCVNILRSIGHNVLVENLASVDLVVRFFCV